MGEWGRIVKVGIVGQGWDPEEAGLGSEGGDCRAGLGSWGSRAG